MLNLQVVDAFADEPFSGNPAAVTIVDSFPPDAWMQNVAREMNLSETAFVVARPDGGHDLRWMTPTAEVDLCGHATLASAHVLGGDAVFHTKSGILTCCRGDEGEIEMDFPADELHDHDGDLPVALEGVRSVRRGRTDLLVEVSDPSWLRTYRPDTKAIAALGVRALILTASGDRAGVDFISRVFAPAVGVAEDPVTGSAHTSLAVHWAQRTGLGALTGYQASARGGTVNVRLTGDRVVVGGRAVTVSEVGMFVNVP